MELPNTERRIIEIETFVDLYEKGVYSYFDGKEDSACYFCLSPLKKDINSVIMEELIKKGGVEYPIINFFHKNCIEFYKKYKGELDKVLLKEEFSEFTRYFKINYDLERLGINKKMFNFPKFN